MLARLARFSYHRRKLVLLGWIGLLIVAVVAGGALKGEWSTSGRLPGTDSQAAYDLLKEQFPARAGEDGSFVFGDIGADPAGVATFLEQAAAVEGVGSVEQPPQVSPGGRVATSSFTLLTEDNDATTATAVAELKKLAEPLENSGGVAFASWRFDEMEMPASEGLGLLAAVIVLLVAFGSVLAMGLPIAHRHARHRDRRRLIVGPGPLHEHARLHDPGGQHDRPRRGHRLRPVHRQPLPGRPVPPAAAGGAPSWRPSPPPAGPCCSPAAPSMISVLGMLLMGLSFLYGLAIGTSIAVFIAVAAALTLLPALLGFIGFNIDKLSIHRKNRTRSRDQRLEPLGRLRPGATRSPSPPSASSSWPPAPSPSSASASGTADAGNNPEGTHDQDRPTT